MVIPFFRKHQPSLIWYGGSFRWIVISGLPLLGWSLDSISNLTDLMVCDDVASCPKLRKFVPLHQAMGYISQVTLANAPDGLMAVYRSTDCREVRVTPAEEYEDDYNFTHKTKWFNVFKLDMSSLSWAHMKSLGSQVLFLGLAAQWCIDSAPDDDVANQIYFSSHLLRFPVQEVQDCFDNGIYSFKDKTFKPLGYESEASRKLIGQVGDFYKTLIRCTKAL